MKTRVDVRFQAEARAYALAFTCEACAGFDPEQLVCAYGYPTACHRQAPLELGRELVFCKAFELA